MDEALLRPVAEQLVNVAGVVAVMLGGSRARGDHTPESDVDLGLYYRPPLDIPALGKVARDFAGEDARVTAPGEWGPWVDGGAWLHVDDAAVDWIYRNLDRVHSSCADARKGRFAFHFQVGHPLGVPDFTYAGEVALGRVLADPTGELRSLQDMTRDFPPSLGEALVSSLWEASFTVAIARKAVVRRDSVYVAGCLFRAVLLCAYALHGAAGRWVVNEKGAVAAAGRLPNAPAGFAIQAQDVLARLGTSEAELVRAIDAAETLVVATSRACG